MLSSRDSNSVVQKSPIRSFNIKRNSEKEILSVLRERQREWSVLSSSFEH